MWACPHPPTDDSFKTYVLCLPRSGLGTHPVLPRQLLEPLRKDPTELNLSEWAKKIRPGKVMRPSTIVRLLLNPKVMGKIYDENKLIKGPRELLVRMTKLFKFPEEDTEGVEGVEDCA